MIQKIKNKIKHWRDLRELRKSNWGREYGWYIEFENEIIGELVEYEFSDMFWDSYKIISENKKWDSYLFDKNQWFSLAFKFKNKAYEAYVTNAIPSIECELKTKKQIKMRGLYLTEL